MPVSFLQELVFYSVMKFLKAFSLTLGLLVLSLLCKTFLKEENLLQSITIIMIYFSIIFIGLNGNKKKFWAFVENTKIEVNPKAIFYGIIGVFGLFLVNYAITNLFWKWYSPEIIESYRPIYMSVGSIIYVILVSPIIEELFFRKLLAKGLYSNYGLKKSVIATALFFSIAHLGGDSGLLPVFLGGVFLTYFFLTYSDILAVIVVHSIYNILNLFVYYRMVKPFDSAKTIILILLTGIVLMGLFIILNRRNRLS
ncbi:CPBP family intramembrane metalloprotease [Muricauda sp. TY007]|uniref:CPBP family intramembrane glutamic endopeptidase n=1 Tax=Allomuricauda sp. TY007 TaxID=2683200 RepID=UPI0013BEBEB7|nr:type II CAAX endopeptidase family protein [Muricauda sp. TY007]NDV17761.1 CPBP family intramembrane metalloprotease [Muricauda sp. TY007]